MYQEPDGMLRKLQMFSDGWKHSSESKQFEKGAPLTSRHVETTCLFCPNYVFLVGTEDLSKIIRRSRILKNFCLHMNISSDVIPDECPSSKFPFCSICENLLHQLWDYQNILDTVWGNISKVVSTIENTVVERECSGHSKPNLIQRNILRDMILEGFRQKLAMTDNLILDDMITKRNTKNESDTVSNIGTFELSPISGEPLVKVGNFGIVKKQGIADKQKETLLSDSYPTTGDISLLKKQEMNIPKPVIEFGVVDNKKLNLEEDVYMLKPRKRRLMFENVEVYKCVKNTNTNGANLNMEYLQCSLCNYNLVIYNKNPRGHTTSYNKMKHHIYSLHQSKIAQQKKNKNQDSSGEKFLQCNICLRPIKRGNSLYNLRLHMFSHKNAEERKAAFIAGEKKCGRPAKKKEENNKTVERNKQQDVQPIYCPICNQAFSQRGRMTSHVLRIHGNDRASWPYIYSIRRKLQTQKKDFEPPVSDYHPRERSISLPSEQEHYKKIGDVFVTKSCPRQLEKALVRHRTLFNNCAKRQKSNLDSAQGKLLASISPYKFIMALVHDEAPGNSEARTNCSFCFNLVFSQENWENEGNRQARIRNRHIKNLCAHLKISSNFVPAIFPLCPLCEDLLIQLRKYQVILDGIKLKIEKVVTMIERKVADGEILNPKSRRNQNVDNFEELLLFRELVLDGYRNKLMEQQQRQQNPNLIENKNIANFALRDENFSHKNLIVQENTTCFSFDPSSLKEGIKSPQNENSIFRPNDQTPFCDQEENHEESFDIEVAEKSLNDFPLLPSNIDEGTDKTAEANVNLTCHIKQELHSSSCQFQSDIPHHDGGESKQESESDDDIYMLDRRKRRTLFEGVEIYRCNTGSNPKVEYLQCSLCNHTLAISKKNVRGEMTSFTKMKLHIYTSHKNAVIADSTTNANEIALPQRVYTCLICSESFPIRQQLRDHKKSHRQENRFGLECDICGRRLKSSSQIKLLTHKFSHKNDEERMASIAAGEKGTCKVFLSTKTLSMNKKVQRKKARKGQDEGVLPINCHICNRSFARRGHLARHLKVHSNPNQLSVLGGEGNFAGISAEINNILQHYQEQTSSVTYQHEMSLECSINNTEEATPVEVLCDPNAMIEIENGQVNQIDGSKGNILYVNGLKQEIIN